MVVRSGGPAAKNFPLGKRLPENARIVLGAADRLTLLDNRGTRELRGPGTFTAIAASVPTQFDPSRLLGAYRRRGRFGALRGSEEPVRPPTIWHVDVSKSANVCVSPANKVVLWRGDVTADVTLTVTGAGGEWKIAWPRGSATFGWPDRLPATDGAQYSLSLPGGPPTTIRFTTLPQAPASLEEAASALIANQCDAQLDLLVDTARVPG